MNISSGGKKDLQYVTLILCNGFGNGCTVAFWADSHVTEYARSFQFTFFCRIFSSASADAVGTLLITGFVGNAQRSTAVMCYGIGVSGLNGQEELYAGGMISGGRFVKSGVTLLINGVNVYSICACQ